MAGLVIECLGLEQLLLHHHTTAGCALAPWCLDAGLCIGARMYLPSDRGHRHDSLALVGVVHFTLGLAERGEAPCHIPRSRPARGGLCGP